MVSTVQNRFQGLFPQSKRKENIILCLILDFNLASTGFHSPTRFLRSMDRKRGTDLTVEASGSFGSRPPISKEETGFDPTLVERRQTRCRRNRNCPLRIRRSEKRRNKTTFIKIK